MRPPRAQLRRVAPVGGQRSAFEDGAAGPDQAGDRRDALSQGGRAVRPRHGQQSPHRIASPVQARQLRPWPLDVDRLARNSFPGVDARIRHSMRGHGNG